MHGRIDMDAGVVFEFRELVEEPFLVVVERDDEKTVLERVRILRRLVFQEIAQGFPHDLGTFRAVRLAKTFELREKAFRNRDRYPFHVLFQVHRGHLDTSLIAVEINRSIFGKCVFLPCRLFSIEPSTTGIVEMVTTRS